MEFKKYSLILPFLLTVNNVFRYVFKRDCVIIKKLIKMDNKLNVGDFSYNFFLVAKKK